MTINKILVVAASACISFSNVNNVLSHTLTNTYVIHYHPSSFAFLPTNSPRTSSPGEFLGDNHRPPTGIAQHQQ